MTTNLLHPPAIDFEEDGDFANLLRRIMYDFGIELTWDDLPEVATVGDLHERLLVKLETGDTCRTSQAFYRLRKAMMAVLGVSRKSIRPNTLLAPLLPEAKRIALWKQIENACYLTFPKLRHPRWARDVIRTLAVMAAIVYQLLVVNRIHHGALDWVLLEAGVLVIFVLVRQALYATTGFLAKGLPARTVGELTKLILQTNFAQFSPDAGNTLPYSRQEVWEQLVYIISEELAVDPAIVTKDTSFVQDLGFA